MIPVSSFSVAARYLRQLLANSIDDLDEGQIYISNPKDLKNLGIDEDQQSLNLFVYRVDYGGYPADAGMQDPIYVRMQCLISALGAKDTILRRRNRETISAGENDLRLVGEVMRVLHQNSVIKIKENEQTLHLQVVFLPLGLDDLNHLWGTQSNADYAYRLSVAYEFSLAQVPLTSAVKSNPRVGSIGAVVDSSIERPGLPEDGIKAPVYSPEVPRVAIDTAKSDWVPHITFLIDDQTLRYTLRLPDTGGSRQFEILLAGESDEEIWLEWEPWGWDYEANEGGWGQAVPDEHNHQVIIPRDDNQQNPLDSRVIDPLAIDLRLKQTVQLPFDTVPLPEVRRQAMLYAVRKVTRQRPQGSPQTIMLRSNPLLISLYADEGPV